MKGYVTVIGIMAVIILSLVTLSVYFQRTLQMETAEQFNKQQLLLANAEASNIQAYLSNVEDEIRHIARSTEMLHISNEADYELLTDMVFKDISNVKKRIDFLDPHGTAFFSRGDPALERPDGGQLGEIAVKLCPSDLLIQQDTKKLYIVAPVCRYESFRGAVVISFDIQDIARAFLGPIKSGARGYAWMMDEKGDLLYHPIKSDMVGRNLYKTDSSCFKCHKTFETEKKIIEGKGDHYGRYVAPTGEDKILAFSTAAVGQSSWIVAVSAPYSEVTMSIRKSMKLYTWIIVLIFVTTSGISTMLIVLNRKREKAEERAQHEKELEMMHSEKLAALERLTSGITSEIGNPLTSTFSLVDMLAEMEEDEFKKETLDTISLHMNRISDILKQLSGFSKMPSPEISPCKVNNIIEASLSLIQYDKRVQRITVVRDLRPDIPAVITDGTQLSQAIVNILLNAADAMPNGGTLTIRSRVKDGSIVVDFEDVGVGIDKQDLDRIFDPFYSTKKKGTGLGLAVSYHIIKKLNGSMTVESECDKGSKFTIILPLNGLE